MSKTAAMKATTVLCEQHRRLEQLLARVGSERQPRMSLVSQLVEELMTHLSIEDQLFLQPIADAARVRIDSYRHAQAGVRNAMLQAVFAEADDRVFDERLRDLVGAFERHARDVERDLLPLVDSRVRRAELEAIGHRMQTLWNRAVDSARDRAVAHVHAAE
jgi:hypothetical protein